MKKRTTYKTSKRISFLLSNVIPKKTVRISTRKAKKTSSHEATKKKTKLGTGRKKSKKQEEEKPKKFQFIHSLNKYNIRYGVFMYIIHFQRNVHSTNGLWCEKSLWGFKAPHGARFIDCTLLRNGSSVRANKWEPKRERKRRKETKSERKTRNEKLIHRLYGFC